MSMRNWSVQFETIGWFSRKERSITGQRFSNSGGLRPPPFLEADLMDTKLLQQLRLLVGKPVEYRGHACRIIEVLDSENALVVRCEGRQRVIQSNQFGEATRRVQQCHTLPLFDENDKLNPVIEAWIEH